LHTWFKHSRRPRLPRASSAYSHRWLHISDGSPANILVEQISAPKMLNTSLPSKMRAILPMSLQLAALKGVERKHPLRIQKPYRVLQGHGQTSESTNKVYSIIRMRCMPGSVVHILSCSTPTKQALSHLRPLTAVEKKPSISFNLASAFFSTFITASFSTLDTSTLSFFASVWIASLTFCNSTSAFFSNSFPTSCTSLLAPLLPYSPHS